MSIANELSSDVAAAVLARNEIETPNDAQELVDILLHFHLTLRTLTVEARRRRLRPTTSNPETPPTINQAASGN